MLVLIHIKYGGRIGRRKIKGEVMYIKHWNCWMWGIRRLDTRLAVDLGKFTLYVYGFPYKDISSQFNA